VREENALSSREIFFSRLAVCVSMRVRVREERERGEHQKGMGWVLSSSPAKFGQCSNFVNGKLLARIQGIARR
jgi:hypothetical protein